MGLFQFPFKQNKPASSSPAPTPATPAPAQTQPERKVTVQSEPVRPQTQPQQNQAQPAAPKPEAAKPPEMVRYLLTMSTSDKVKLATFFGELSRKCINEWRNVQARVAMHTDKKKVRVEVRGTHEEIEKFIAWCRLDHYGAHATIVEKYAISSMLPLGETCADIKYQMKVKNIFK